MCNWSFAIRAETGRPKHKIAISNDNGKKARSHLCNRNRQRHYWMAFSSTRHMSNGRNSESCPWNSLNWHAESKFSLSWWINNLFIFQSQLFWYFCVFFFKFSDEMSFEEFFDEADKFQKVYKSKQQKVRRIRKVNKRRVLNYRSVQWVFFNYFQILLCEIDFFQCKYN